MKQPEIISFPSKGNRDEGHLHIVQHDTLPFVIERVFYTMDTPMSVTRGRHAHHETEMILIAIKGTIRVRTITIHGEEKTFILSEPSEGLYIPALCWHEMNYSDSAVQLVLCNSMYNAADYIRDWQQFKNLQLQHGTP